ncbi:hypothetical protein Asp14428_33130 [Actinoplanes sp. NBRC 14428]|nr:hypothetical protein Asp14428_33130 [Actinoplanes sp. NBRC 14428]
MQIPEGFLLAGASLAARKVAQSRALPSRFPDVRPVRVTLADPECAIRSLMPVVVLIRRWRSGDRGRIIKALRSRRSCTPVRMPTG